jgi:hypothetical protein
MEGLVAIMLTQEEREVLNKIHEDMKAFKDMLNTCCTAMSILYTVTDILNREHIVKYMGEQWTTGIKEVKANGTKNEIIIE